MSVNVDSIKRTANVIQLSNVHFQNNLGKQLRFEKIDFSNIEKLYANPARILDWLNGTKTKSEISWKEHPDDYWYNGWITYNKRIDLAALKNAGAKYFYILGTHYINKNNDTETSNTCSMCNFKYVPSTQKYASAPSFSLSENGFIVSRIAEDDNVALGGTFKAYISEVVIPIDFLISVNSEYVYFGCINEADSSQEIYNYEHTAISEPIVYVIYED